MLDSDSRSCVRIKPAENIPSTFANDSRLAEEHSDEVAKCAQGDEKIEAFDSATRAKDLLEEQAGGYLCRLLELRLRNCHRGQRILLKC